ncbi:unnamed protein product, partial [Mesorhabditis spiculigera]
MRWIVYSLFVGTTIAQSSLLLERACQKNPRLPFCQEMVVSAHKVSDEDLVVPPNPPPADPHEEELIFPPPVPDAFTKKSNPPPTISTTTIETATFPTILTTTEDEAKKLLEAPFGMIPLPKPSGPELDAREEENNGTTPRTVRKTLESDTHVLVFVSEFCVVNRERFVRRCHGEIERDEVDFCKSYPPACSGTSDVIPVLGYCGRYFMEYPKLCRHSKIHELALQFCFAFEKFCLPELEKRKPKRLEQNTTPRPNLQRCEDVVDEARKACNPFPKLTDSFNVLRCAQFLKHCQKFVDWQ